MFAVPGWSVNAGALKTQKVEAKPATDASADPNDESQNRKNKKRKRKSDVNAKNLVDMWETVVEGKAKPEGDAASKKQKTERDGEKATETQSTQGQEKKDRKEKKEKKEKKDKKKDKKERRQPDADSKASEKKQVDNVLPTAPVPPAPTHLTPLQASMRQKLISARFRHLNQTLYTTPSANALSLFSQSPEMFDEYHSGFRKQVEVWPENPVDKYMAQILVRGKARIGSNQSVLPLPRTAGTCRIADLGCGDAKLAQSLQKAQKKLNLEIHSFDLVSKHPLVTRADIANVPLPDASVDVAIFCLALMGTNWIDFIDEAFRILRWKGELWVAEIKSRFARVGGPGGKRVVEHSVGNRKKIAAAEKEREIAEQEQDLAVEVDGQERGQETDVSAFVSALARHGFSLNNSEKAGPSIDLHNKMFVKMQFVKASTPVRGKHAPAPGSKDDAGEGKFKKKKKFIEVEKDDGMNMDENSILKPCVYKLR